METIQAVYIHIFFLPAFSKVNKLYKGDYLASLKYHTPLGGGGNPFSECAFATLITIYFFYLNHSLIQSLVKTEPFS